MRGRLDEKGLVATLQRRAEHRDIRPAKADAALQSPGGPAKGLQQRHPATDAGEQHRHVASGVAIGLALPGFAHRRS
jgi:hypothetical protein